MTLTAPTFGKTFGIVMCAGATKRTGLDVFAARRYMMIRQMNFMPMPKNHETACPHTLALSAGCINNNYTCRRHDNYHSSCRHSYNIQGMVALDQA